MDTAKCDVTAEGGFDTGLNMATVCINIIRTNAEVIKEDLTLNTPQAGICTLKLLNYYNIVQLKIIIDLTDLMKLLKLSYQAYT